MKTVQKLGVAKFRVATPGVTGQELEVNFLPLIEQFKLKGNYTLIHWQARPKGHREWGVYSSKDDTYTSVSELKINMSDVSTLQLDDMTAKTIPSAVLYSGTDEMLTINDKTILGRCYLDDLS